MRPTDQRSDPVAGAQPDTDVALALIESARRLLEMDDMELRIAHWGCGGNVKQADLVAFVEGRGRLSEREYNTLAAAINDRLIAGDHSPRIPYSDDRG